MELRAADHEIGTGLADFSAVHHQSKMAWLHMGAAFLQAMSHGRMKADLMALKTGSNAGRHRGVFVCVADDGIVVKVWRFREAARGPRFALSLASRRIS